MTDENAAKNAGIAAIILIACTRSRLRTPSRMRVRRKNTRNDHHRHGL